MEFTIDRKELKSELVLLDYTIPRKSADRPILSSILIDPVPDKDAIIITGSNGVTALMVRLNVTFKGDKRKSICVNHTKFLELVASLKEDTLTLKADKNDYLIVESGKSKLKLLAETGKNYPALPKIESVSHEISSMIFADLLRKVTFAVSDDESLSKLNFNGVNLTAKEGTLRAVASDTARLAITEYFHDSVDKTIDFNIVIPEQAAITLLRLCRKLTGNMLVGVKNDRFILRTPNKYLVSQLSAGTYPNYEPLLITEETAGNEASIHCDTLKSSVKRVKLMADELALRANFKFSQNELEITTSSSKTGECKEIVEIDSNIDNLEVTFNVGFFDEFLSLIEEKDSMIKLLVSEDKKKFCLQDDGSSGYEYKMLMTPMSQSASV